MLNSNVTITLDTSININDILINVCEVVVSTSNPTANMWWLHTKNPKIPIENIAYTIPK